MRGGLIDYLWSGVKATYIATMFTTVRGSYSQHSAAAFSTGSKTENVLVKYVPVVMVCRKTRKI